MTKDETMKLAQDACPYFDERLRGAFYEGFITALAQLPDTTKMMGLIPSEWPGLDEPPNSTTDFVEPEPVAWVLLDMWKTGEYWPDDCFNSEGGEGMTPLYTAPPKQEFVCSTGLCHYKHWVGLTDEDITAIWCDFDESQFDKTVRAIEAKLREKNHD